MKSTVILQNVTKNQCHEREKALEALWLVEFKKQPRTAHARKHLGKFVLTRQPQHEPQDGVQCVGVDRQAKKHHRASVIYHNKTMSQNPQ